MKGLHILNDRKYPVPAYTKERPILFQTKANYPCTYVYVVTEKKYDPVRKYNVDKRVEIGRLDYKLPSDWKKIEGGRPTEMFINENYSTYFPELAYITEPEEEPEKEQGDESNGTDPQPDTGFEEDEKKMYLDYVKVGVHMVVDVIVKSYRIEEILKKAGFTAVETNRMLDIAVFMIIEEDNAALHFETYAQEHLQYETDRIISDTMVGRLFASITNEKIQKFMDEWNKANAEKSKNSQEAHKIYIGADGTNTPSEAGDIDYVEFGASKEHDGNPIINFMLAVDYSTKIPLYYDEYFGSINDLAECIILISKMLSFGYKDIGFVFDRGFFSKKNIEYCDQKGLSFIIMAKGWKKFIRDIVLQTLGTFESTEEAYISRFEVYGTTTTGMMFGKERYIHVYFNPHNVAYEQAEFRRKLRVWEKKLDNHIQTNETVD